LRWFKKENPKKARFDGFSGEHGRARQRISKNLLENRKKFRIFGRVCVPLLFKEMRSY